MSAAISATTAATTYATTQAVSSPTSITTAAATPIAAISTSQQPVVLPTHGVASPADSSSVTDQGALVTNAGARNADAALGVGAIGSSSESPQAAVIRSQAALLSSLPLDVRATAFQARVWEALTRIAPGSTTRMANAYYKTDEEFLFAVADAMREEYRAIVEAGLVLQLDDPALATNWDMINPEPLVEDYRKFASMQVAALNHAGADYVVALNAVANTIGAAASLLASKSPARQRPSMLRPTGSMRIVS